MNKTKDNLKNYYGIKYEDYKKEKRTERFINNNNHLLKECTIEEDLVLNKAPTKSLLFKYIPSSIKRLIPYLSAIEIIAICTVISLFFLPYLKDSNLIMVYLLGVAIVALLGKVGPAIFASILSVLAYDFFLLPPFYSFTVSDIQYFFTLIVMMLIALIINFLTIHARRHREVAIKAQTEIEKERFHNILLTSISHDLRTPLTAIMGSSSSLLQSGPKLGEELRRELTQNIYDESERLNRLVNNILKIIQLESGSIRLSKQSYALEEIIGISLNKFSNQLTNRRIEVKLPKNMPLIYIDSILIGQVFINLIDNAIKFSPSNTPIEISAEVKDQHVLVRISDKGPGINPREIDKIFDKFYRGQKPETNGIGLGLAICKGIILSHKGEIWAETSNKGGAVFCFTLPTKG